MLSEAFFFSSPMSFNVPFRPPHTATTPSLVHPLALRHAPKWRQGFEMFGFAVGLLVLLGLIVHGAQSLQYPWKWAKVPDYLFHQVDGKIFLGPLMEGLVVTLQICALATPLALFIGLFLALLRLSDSPLGRSMARLIIELIRNTPLLIQMLIFYFIIADLLSISRLSSGIFCLAFHEGSYCAEIIRGGILSVRQGQHEASDALGLSIKNRYRHIIIPQALPLILPPLGGVLINLLKHSSFVSAIAIFDLTTQARSIVSDTYMAFEIWLTTAALYMLMTLSLSLLIHRLEQRFQRRA